MSQAKKKIAKIRRRAKNKERLIKKINDPALIAERKNSNPQRCDLCGGRMSWCMICECWTSNCCQDYGTCMCS